MRRKQWGRIAVAAVLVVALAGTPVASATEDEGPVIADASLALLPDPSSLPMGDVEPAGAVSVALSAPASAQAPVMLAAELDVSNPWPTYAPDVGRFVVVHENGILSLAPDGTVLAQAATTLPVGGLTWDGGVLLRTNDALLEIDPITLDVTTTPTPFIWSDVAVLEDELWFLLRDGSAFTVVDRTTSAMRTVALPAGVDVSGSLKMRHSPGLGDSVALSETVFADTATHIVDLSTEPLTIQRTIDNEEIRGVAPSDERIFLSAGINSGTIRTRSADTGALISTTQFDSITPFDFAFLSEAALIAKGDEIRTLDGDLVRSLSDFRSPRALSGNGRHLAMRSSNGLEIHTLGPSVTGMQQAFFQPGWYDELVLTGEGLEGASTATINGRVVPQRPVQGGLALDVAALPNTTDVDGHIVLSGVLGTTQFTIPATPPPGRAAVHVRLVDIAESEDAVMVSVGCNRWPGQGVGGFGPRIVGGGDLVFDVPGGRFCSANVHAGGTRSGFFDPLRPGSFVDTNADGMAFTSGRPVHVQFTTNGPTRPAGFDAVAPIWIFASDIGGAPAGVVYPFSVVCGTWSQNVRIRSGFGARLVVPDDQTGETCRIRLTRKRGAERVSSFSLRTDRVLASSGREIEFGANDGSIGRYVQFVMDFGEPEAFVPQVIGVPYEDIGSKRNAGMVHVLPVDGVGIPDHRNAIRLRQGRNGLGQAAEAGDRFGESSVVADFNGDGWLDIAIGAPGEDLAGAANAGIVHVINGGPNGFKKTPRTRLHQNMPEFSESAERGDRFGEALAAVDFNGDGYLDLAIGVPGERLGSARRAGLVHVVFGGPGGLGSAAEVATLTQDTDGFHTSPSAGDQFGFALDGWMTQLVIGVPGEDIAGENNAGAIHVVDGVTGEVFFETQTPRRGTSEAGDRFGASVAITERSVVVGAPGEDSGSRKNTGAAFLFVFFETRWSAGLPQEIDLRALNLPGRLPARAEFGSEVAIFGSFRGGALLISAPGYSVDGRADAGRLFVGVGETSLYSEGGYWSQDVPTVPGAATAGARFGEGFDVNRRGGLLIAATGATVSGRAGAGVVYATADGLDWVNLHQDRRGISTRAERDDAFGFTLAS